MKLVTIDALTDEIIGEEGTPNRDLFEYELQMDITGDTIKEARKNKQMTKTHLANSLGLRKSIITKLENSAKNFNIGILSKALKAVGAKFSIYIEVEDIKQFMKI